MPDPPLPRSGRLAVVMPTWLGDVVMATPALDRLRRARPELHVTAITEPSIPPLLEGTPVVDAITPVRGKGIGGPRRTARAIRAARADATLLLPNSLRAGLSAWMARSPVRIGRDRNGRAALLTHALRAPKTTEPISTVVFYEQLVAFALGETTTGDEIGPPRLGCTEADRAAAVHALGDLAAAPLVVLVPGGNRASKRWPVERFAAIARTLRDRDGLVPVISGAPAERPLCAELATAVGEPVLDLAAGDGGVPAVKGVIGAARLVVSNDTGPRHIAAGLGTPCVALFGPTDARWTTLSGVRERVLTADPFLPPETVADRHPAYCRVDRIPVSDVLHAASVLLQSGDASAAPPAHAAPGTPAAPPRPRSDDAAPSDDVRTPGVPRS